MKDQKQINKKLGIAELSFKKDIIIQDSTKMDSFKEMENCALQMGQFCKGFFKMDNL